MRMKPLNHKERRKAIWKFIASLIPFLITMPLFVYVFCFTAERHSLYVENRYEKKKNDYREQAIHEERIDTVMTRIREVVKGNKKDYEYKETQRLLSSTIQDALEITSTKKEEDPYQSIFEGSKEVLGVVDSIYIVKSDLIVARRRYFDLREHYNKQKLKQAK